MKDMFSIGEFSNLSKISIYTLRYYDKIGLFKPAQTDQITSYRYYTYSQLMKLDIIKVCRDIGLDIETIKQLFTESTPLDFKQGLLAQQEKIAEKILSLNTSLNTLKSIYNRIDIAGKIGDDSTFYFRNLKERIAFSTISKIDGTESEISSNDMVS